jgi:type I restriction enzyme S subunit
MVVEKGYKMTEVGLIPEEWEVKSIDDVFDFYSTANYSKAQMDLDNEVGCLHYGLIHAIPNSYYDLRNGIKYYISQKQSKYEYLQDGDVVMVDASEDLTGVNKSVEIHGIEGKKFISGLHTFLLRDKGYLTNYIRGAVLNSEIVKNQMLRLAVGMKVFGVSKPQLKTVFIPIPPLPEQTAIANALSDMDALIAQTEKLIEKKKAIKQGVMQELLKPKEGWVMKKLGDNALILRGGSPRPIEDYITTASNGVNWIKIGDVGKNAKYITSTEEKITPAGMSRSRTVKPGDFLLSNSMSFGRPYIMQIGGCIHDGWLVITEYELNFDRDFLYYILGSESVFVQYKSMASGSSVLNLNKEIVKEVKVVCPKNIDEQKQIARVLSDIDIDLDFTETKLQKLKFQKQGMMQALLTGKIRLV